MKDYSKMYSILFNAVTDAIEAIKAGDTAAAQELLTKAQQTTEEMYIRAED